MERNRVVLVDVNDNELGTADKMQAHEKGLLHRAFSIFVVRETNGVKEVLLQQRALTKYHCAGLWSNTCCSHPQSGENITQSAINRLTEELGFTVNNLIWVDSHCYKAKLSNDLIEHEFDHLLGVTFEERVQSKMSLELAKKRRAKKKRQKAKMAKRLSKVSSPT